MRRHFAKKLLGALLGLLPLSATAQVGQYRGYVMSQSLLSERLLDQAEGINYSNFLYPLSGQPLLSMLDLLGSYQGGSLSKREFRNGQPNSVNMLLWYMVLNSFAFEVQKNCNNTFTLPLSTAFRQTLNQICQWPQATAQSESAMQAFWLAIMGYDAPEEEFQAWREFFLNSSYASKPAHETVSAMVLAMVYNPHFLLRK